MSPLAWDMVMDEEGTALDPVLIIQEPIKHARPYGAPLNMIFDQEGILYTSPDGRSKILKVSKEGETELIDIPELMQNHYIVFGGEGVDEETVYVTTFDGKKIYQFPKSLLDTSGTD